MMMFHFRTDVDISEIQCIHSFSNAKKRLVNCVAELNFKNIKCVCFYIHIYYFCNFNNIKYNRPQILIIKALKQISSTATIYQYSEIS